MFRIVPFTLFALAVSSVTALVVPRGPDAPTDWSSTLEDYSGYHTRYMAISCYAKHNEAFFDQCCHPLQKGAQPEPACQATSGADGDSDNDDDCEDDDDSSSTVMPTTSSATTVTPSPATTKASPATTKASPPTTKASPTATPTTTSAGKAQATNAPVNVDVHTGGFATFFYQNGVAGACGKVNSDSAFVAAMDSRTYGNTSRKSSLCGRQVEITNTKNHKTVRVIIADACPTCRTATSIDLSVGAFKQIATEAEGEVPITWKFV